MIQGLLPFKYENDKQKSNITGFGGLPIKIAGDEILLRGDIIMTANDLALNNEDRYRKFVQKIKIGDKVRLKYYREGKTGEVEFVIPERPILPWDLPS